MNKSLKKNKEEKRKRKKMRVVWSLKVTEGSICIFLKVWRENTHNL